MTKMLLIVAALAAGAGGAAAYEYVSIQLALPQEQQDGERVFELEGKLIAVEQKIQGLSSVEDTPDSQIEIIAARLGALENRLARLQEEQAGKTSSSTAVQNDSKSASIAETEPGHLPEDRTLRISGEELVAALKDLPEEGVEMIRGAIRKEVERARRQQDKKNPRAELEKKAEAGIQKAATALSLTPVQVEQAKEIAARFIDRLMEIDRTAREQNDPALAENARKELGTELRAEVVRILTPEQLDRARELDPNGIGKEYPRGF